MHCFGAIMMLVATAAAKVDFIPESKDIRLSQSGTTTNIDSRNMHSKLFAFIRIQPDTCTGNNNVLGTCMTSTSCTTRGGQNIGSCARGLGTCCQLDIRCAAGSNSVVVRDNNTNLLNPMESVASTCRFDIEKAADVCQLRLDIESFSLRNPDMIGECPEASMTITDSPTATNFKLCGQQQASRIYVAYGESNNRISITFRISAGDMYRVKVTQIKCVHQRVPSQCLQYFENERGVVKSFGWPNYMINHRYTVCAARISGLTRITWTNCSTEGTIQNHFSMSKYMYDADPALKILGALGQNSCSTISHVDVIGDGKRCGNYFLPAAVSGQTGPFMLDVNFVEDTFARLPPTNVMQFMYLTFTATTPPAHPCEAVQGYSTCTVTAAAPYARCDCTRATTEPPLPVNSRKGFCLQYSESST